MISRLRRIVRRRRRIDPRRLCAFGVHDLVEVRVHAPGCDLGTCPGSHPAVRCPHCGGTWDLLTGPDPRREALR